MSKIAFRKRRQSNADNAAADKIVPICKHERRRSPRHRYERYIFCATRHLFFQGELKDYNLGGLFVKTAKPLPVGTIVTLALPYVADKNNRCKGQVIRRTSEGIGIEFFSDPAERTTRYDLF